MVSKSREEIVVVDWSWRVCLGIEGSPLSRVVSPAEVDRSMRSSRRWWVVSSTSRALSE